MTAYRSEFHDWIYIRPKFVLISGDMREETNFISVAWIRIILWMDGNDR